MGERGFKILLFLFIVFLFPNVFAQSINSDSYSQKDSFNTASRYDYSTNQYLGDDTNFSIGTIGTRYNGKSYYFQFNFHKSLTANKIYELKVSSTTSDFTSYINKDYITPLCYSSFAYNFNTKECGDISVISVIRGSGTQSKDFTIRFSPLQAITYWGFKLQSGFNNLTGVNNFLINDFDLTEVNANDTDELINNQNQNAQDIIDNQNQNTQDIIDNLNSNCKNTTITLNYDYADVLGQSLGSSGNQVQLNGSAISKYFVIKPNTIYTISHLSGNTPSDFYYCLYSATKSVLSCSLINTSTDTTFTASNYASYLRVSMYNFRQLTLTGNICNNWEQEAQNETNKNVKDVNDTLKNPNIDNGTGSDFFNNFTTSDNGGISAIVSKPLTIINNLLSNNNQCANLTLPSFMGVSNATLPSGCILWNNASTIMITLWNTFVCGLGSYFILKDIFRIIEDLKNPDNDKVEVMDL